MTRICNHVNCQPRTCRAWELIGPTGTWTRIVGFKVQSDNQLHHRTSKSENQFWTISLDEPQPKSNPFFLHHIVIMTGNSRALAKLNLIHFIWSASTKIERAEGVNWTTGRSDQSSWSRSGWNVIYLKFIWFEQSGFRSRCLVLAKHALFQLS